MRKRKLSVAIVVLMIASVLLGCSSSAPGSQNSGQDDVTDAAPTAGKGDTTTNISSSADASQSIYAGRGMDATINPNVTAYVSDPPQGMTDTAAGDGKTLTIAQGGEPNILYPQNQNIMATAVICQQIYEPLFRYNCFTDEYESLFAESWEQVDSTCLRINLRKGVKCHAGYEMTANDVLWTLTQGYESPMSNWIFGFFSPELSKVIDDYTIEIRTEEPFGPWLTYLSNWSVGGIVNRQAYEEQTPDDYARNPTGGAGPWEFVEWIAGDRIILKRFEDYYGEKPYYENLIIRNIPDDVTRTLSLEAGEVDAIITVDTANAQAIIDSPAANLYSMPSWQLIYCGFNLVDSSKPWANQKVRDAMYYALDIDTMTPIAFDGWAIRADGYFPPSQKCYAPIKEEDKEKYAYNLEKAKQLMIEAGYPDGFSMRLYTCDTIAWMNLTEMVQNAWAAIGIDAAVSVYDQNAHWDLVYAGDFDAFIARHTSHGNDGNYMFNKLISWGTGSSNPGKYNSPEFDDLMTQAMQSINDDFRYECYHRVNDLIREEKPWINLANPSMTYGCRSTLQGVYPSAPGLMDARYLRPITVE